MRALDYNMKKLNHPDVTLRAEVLASNFASLAVSQVMAEVKALCQLRPALNRYTYHTSLNFPNNELQPLNNEKLTAIAGDYLQEMGFTNNQYIIFRHSDAGHPHLHLLVNRITFDGDVVSDSNNYKKSEAILRKLEIRYNLTRVAPSNKAAQRAVTKSEIEMIERTDKPSHKMLLQELMNGLLRNRNMSVSELIKRGEQLGIHFLFNQASTGRVSGVTYFYEGFKIKGQSLGNRYKWAELNKTIDYEQRRDSEAISQANSRTKAKYGTIADGGALNANLRGTGSNLVPENIGRGTDEYGANEEGTHEYEERSQEGNVNVDRADLNSLNPLSAGFYDSPGVQISDDIDDEDIHGRNRRRKKQTRTNTR